MSSRALGMSSALLLSACGDPGEATRGRGFGQQSGPASQSDGDGQNPDVPWNPGVSDDPGAYDAGHNCARVDVGTIRVVPTVWLLVDGSGSMVAPMSGSADSRWAVLREALLADGSGLVPTLEGAVAFGLFAYDGGLSLPGVKTPACPRVIDVEPAIDNLDAIQAAYPALPMGASTPTNWALLELKDRVLANLNPDDTAPTYVILATDGRPNVCDFHDGVPETPETEAQAVSTVAQLADAGIKTFAISMAGDEDAVLRKHLEDVAAAGATGSPVFTPTTSDGLVDALYEIISGTVTCDVALIGELRPGYECQGEVKVNGTPLTCGDQDGFRVKDDLRTLELMGAACETLKQDPKAKLEANFPCDVVVF